MTEPKEPTPLEVIPLSDLINALPAKVRIFLHDLETRCDPSGDVAARVFAKEAIEVLNNRLQASLYEVEELKDVIRCVVVCAKDGNWKQREDVQRYVAEALKDDVIVEEYDDD